MLVVSKRRLFVPLAVLFEGLLGVVGVVIAQATGIDLTARLNQGCPSVLASALVGALATTPSLAGLTLLMRSTWRPWIRLRQLVDQLIGPLVANASLAALGAVALAAGWGEEMLFRGALQPWGASWLGLAPAWFVVSVLFGALHAASAAYFFLAACMGGYLGWLSESYGLAAAITSHTLYDLVALYVLKRRANRHF